MTSGRSWWVVIGAGATLVVTALVWLSVLVLRYERESETARLIGDHQQAVRLALWRMDSWIGPFLAQEAARPYFEYSAFYSPSDAVGADLKSLESGDVMTPSPLLTFSSQFFPLHFQLSGDSPLVSPQLPARPFRDLPAARSVSEGEWVRRQEQFDRLRAKIDFALLSQRLVVAEILEQKKVAVSGSGPRSIDPVSQYLELPAEAKSQLEYDARVACSVENSVIARDEIDPEQACGNCETRWSDVGPLTPIWLDGSAESAAPALILVRRVVISDRELFQGVLVDWGQLQARLSEEIHDLFGVATLERVPDGSDASRDPRQMANLPAALVVEPPSQAPLPLMTTTRVTLAIGWIAALGALVAIAFTLKKSVEYGARRQQFVSAVTHELRTPLTTFRMYAGMLADGMIRDEEKRRSYLETLRQEASRLSAMVENVLAFAHLERGKKNAPRRERIDLGALTARLEQLLEQRAAPSGMTLCFETEGDATEELHVDADSIAQVLYNLVDNACKYANGTNGREIACRTRLADGALSFQVTDRGPGIARSERGAIFEAFERGESARTGDAAGVGLGLAIARRMARQMGGDLLLDPSPDRGACFRLTVPSDG